MSKCFHLIRLSFLHNQQCCYGLNLLSTTPSLSTPAISVNPILFFLSPTVKTRCPHGFDFNANTRTSDDAVSCKVAISWGHDDKAFIIVVHVMRNVNAICSNMVEVSRTKEAVSSKSRVLCVLSLYCLFEGHVTSFISSRTMSTS